MRNAIRRELRVAFSLKTQPLWFRLFKWAVIVAGIALLWGTPYVWWFLAVGLALGLSMHAVYRWKTHAWTRPWGGWDAVELADRDAPAKPNEK